MKDSFDRKRLRIPRNTRNLANLPAPDNFHLKYNRFARYDEEEAKFKFFHVEKKKGREGESYAIQPNYGTLDWAALCHRLKTAAEAVLPAGKLQTKSCKPHGRWVVGLGGASVYETGLTLHHVYGFPYIPASTLKGALRSYVIREAFDSDEKKAWQDETFCRWFGCPKESVLKKARQGDLVFFDAFPMVAPKLETDIMNPHYAPYYSDKQKKTPPADYHSPVPIPFLTVAETAYQFLFGFRTFEKDAKLGEKLAQQWLEAALQDGGLGAKTAVGYGYFH